MKAEIDFDKKLIFCVDAIGQERILPIYSREGFTFLSKLWLKQEWNQLHWQSFSWMGYQIWQLPEDLIRLQEVVVSIKPDVIIETGVNQGGSAVFFASLCRLMGRGHVISIDVSIPESLRLRIEQSPFSDLITLIEGDSASPDVVEQVTSQISAGETVFVFLDSDHSKSHVSKELEAYAPLVSSGSYIVATDGVMETLADTPYGQDHWVDDNPAAAAREFVANHPEFVIKRPPALYGEEHVVEIMTFWPDAWIQRLPEK